jgi:iron complex transport system substrate-binding protein
VNRTSAANLLLLLVGIAMALAVAWPRSGGSAGRTIVRASRTTAVAKPVSIGSGEFAVADASGHLVALRNYRRIVSTNLVTDRLLVELCEPTRILAVSTAAAARRRDGYRYQGMTTVDGFGPPEAMVALKPDLVLTNSFGAPGSADRLRGAGIEVFDLGELRGESSLGAVVSSLGLLLGAPERAQRLLDGFASRMHALPARLGTRQPKRALFLSTLGPDLQGGTSGTSYHDIMTAAGLVDVAAEHYRAWPAYASEQVLALAPDIIVTRAGFAAGICNYPGMDHVGPCRGQGRIIELDGELLDEPGLAMLDAAEELFALAYGAQP